MKFTVRGLSNSQIDVIYSWFLYGNFEENDVHFRHDKIQNDLGVILSSKQIIRLFAFLNVTKKQVLPQDF
jgi:hypothetical protein